MSLHGNGSVLLKMPRRCFAGSAVSVEPQLRANFGMNGSMRNRFYQDRAITALKLYSIPEGMYAGNAWLLPQKAGAMSSHNYATLTVTGTAAPVSGITTTATTSFAFTADAVGSLITSGSGSASFSITTNTPLLTASLNASGSATFAITGSATMSADGYAAGSATFAFSATNSAILPTDTTSPLRTGSATFSITATLVPYALGNMSGSTIDNTGLTTTNIAAAVLAAAAVEPIASDIKKVNALTVSGAGTSGSPWGP